jgi:hypothetical protein
LKYHESFKIDSTILKTSREARSLISLTGFESKSFSLLWRGSRDGFEASTFHSRCDGKANTMTLIKNTHGYVFGGYTAVPWSSPPSQISHSDTTAFLFSLKNPSNNPLKLKVIEPDNAVFHDLTMGPVFGRYYRGRDLSYYYFNQVNNCMKFKSYESPDGENGVEGGKYVVGGPTNFYQTAEIEVFQIINLKKKKTEFTFFPTIKSQNLSS